MKIAYICQWLAVLCVGVVLQGCALLGGPADKAAKAAGKLVTEYCDNVTIPEIRDQIRAKVNEYAAPNSVAVNCAKGGPALQTSGKVTTAK